MFTYFFPVSRDTEAPQRQCIVEHAGYSFDEAAYSSAERLVTDCRDALTMAILSRSAGSVELVANLIRLYRLVSPFVTLAPTSTGVLIDKLRWVSVAVPGICKACQPGYWPVYAVGLGRRRWSFLQQCYLHCLRSL